MSAALEFGLKECVYKCECCAESYYTRAEAKHVCIVVKAGELSAVGLGAASRTDTMVFICRHGHADSGAADKNAELVRSVLDPCADLVSDNRIIAGCGGVNSDVGDVISFVTKVSYYLVFHIGSRVIAANYNLKILFHII